MRRPTRRRLLKRGSLLGGLLLAADATGAAPTDRADTSPGAPPNPSPAAGWRVLGEVPAGSLWMLHGNGSDSSELWETAFDGIARAGGGAVRASGTHLISRPLGLPDVAALDIAGEGPAVLRKADPGREFRLFTADTPRTPLALLSIRDLAFVGDWDRVRSMGGDGSRCIGVRGYHRVTLRNLTAEAFRNMTFTADDCDEVRVENCRILRSARDPINLTGSRFVKVVGCTIQNAWDDAIAVHVPRDVTDEARRYGTLIAHNQILQANGIKVLGGRDVSIIGNQILAPNNYGIYLGRDPVWREGNVPHRNIVVANNLIGEMLPHEYLSGQGNVGAGIFLTDPGRAVLSTRIHGNVISKYKPSGRGVFYSHWGFGPHPGERRLFTSEGWTDPELLAGHQGKGIGIRIIAANADDHREIATDANGFANLAARIERLVAE